MNEAEPGTRRLEEAAVPVYLITGGLLVLISDYSGISVSRTWPLLLIVFGGMRVLIHWRQSQVEEDASS